MRTSLVKLIGFIFALTLSATASAIGLGGISVDSALGQPLNANIELVAVSNAEKTSLIARLASPDVYAGAGLEYPYGNKFTFEIESHANGEPYLKVSSAQPVNDPFVSLLVELTWSSGKLLREYTFLLDPPGYVAEQPKQAEMMPVAPVAQAMPDEAAPVAAAPAEVAPTESQPAPEQMEAAADKMAEEPAEKPAAVKQPAAPAKPSAPAPMAEKPAPDNITVQRGDTLSKIAAQYKPADVSLERMLVALYRANADQFDGKNMNRIRTGKILRLPDQNELTGVVQSAAVKEIRVQTEDWNAYRQKLSGAATVSTKPQEAKQAASGKITSSVIDKAPVAKESAKEVLKLSRGEAPGDKAAGGKTMSAQDKKNAAQEDAIAKSKALKEEQTRTALLQKNMEDMKRLAQLKSEAAAAAKGKPADKSTPAMSAAPASAVAAAGTTKPKADKPKAADKKPVDKPTPADKPKPKVVVAEPSLLDEPLYLAVGAAVLLGLGGAGFMLARRRKAKTPAAQAVVEEEVGSTTGQLTAPVAPSPDTGDFTAMADADAAAEAQPSDDVDPISEADLFLNFGRDAQAEEILKEALRNTPNNHQIHLKLLGIYANRKDVNSFSSIARQLHDTGDEVAWQQAAAMGRRIDPGNPMYGSEGSMEDADSATMQTAAIGGAVPDFMQDETPAAQETVAPVVDFDLGAPAEPVQEEVRGSEQTMILSPSDMAAAQAEAMDFDITSTIPPASAPAMDFEDVAVSAPAVAEPAEAAAPNLDDLIFDVTSTHAPAPEAQPEEIKPVPAAAAEDGGMEFTLDFPVEEAAPAPATQAADTGLAGITLNLDEEDLSPLEPQAEAAPAEVRDEHWHEVATKLDLAKAYQEMGDATGAREILEEVLAEGDAGQREAAQAMLDQLG